MTTNTPTDYQAFDPLTVPIAGVNLVEASAGTGKTWSIAALYLRLVLQQRLPVASILVVTYTRAATAELKSRLRARLNEALYYLEDRLQDDEVDDLRNGQREERHSTPQKTRVTSRKSATWNTAQWQRFDTTQKGTQKASAKAAEMPARREPVQATRCDSSVS